MPVDWKRDVVLRWEDQDVALAPLLREGGITAVLAREPREPFRHACQAAGIRVEPTDTLAISDLEGLRRPGAKPGAFGSGLWPGVSAGPTAEDITAASASRQPWLDANGFRIRWLGALAPEIHPVLAYLPDADAGVQPSRLLPYGSLELALVEAWVNGGNYVLAVEPRYREALLGGEERALAAWRSLGRTARWLRRHQQLWGKRIFPHITALADGGEECAELLNLMFRQNVSPDVCAAAAPPAPDPQRRLEVVAAGIAAPEPEAAQRILAHASAGATVVVDTHGDGPPWWRRDGMKLVHDEPDRATYSCGRGRLLAYKGAIEDPSDFALDVIDIVTHQCRAVRIWDASSAIAIATEGGGGNARAIVVLVNYSPRVDEPTRRGRPARFNTLVQVDGRYSSAALLRPEDAEPLTLKTAARGRRTEVLVPRLGRVAVLLLA